MQLISGQYYSAQLRFFRQLCTAAKVDTVSKLAQKMLDEGKCVVIGLQSTGEPCAVYSCSHLPCSRVLELYNGLAISSSNSCTRRQQSCVCSPEHCSPCVVRHACAMHICGKLAPKDCTHSM